MSNNKEIQLRQLEALAQAKLEQAESEKLASGRMSPEVVAEAYRIMNQIHALLEDRTLNTNDPNYLFGLYTALLKLHKLNEDEEKTLFGQATPRTIGEIARFKFMLEELKTKIDPSRAEPETTVRDRFRKLLLA